MQTIHHPQRTSRRLRQAFSVCVIGFLAGGISACRRQHDPPQPVAPVPESAPPVAAAPPAANDWIEMKSLAPGKWEAMPGAAEVAWDDASQIMKIGVGTDLNGLRWTGPLPTVPYVVELEARRVSGSDFFCGLTFPVRSGKEFVTFIAGGWGGSLVGISSIDGYDASENSTGSQFTFEDQRWYRIRVQVDKEHLQAWIDDQQVVDTFTEGQKLSLRAGPIEDCAPFGLATWMTSAEVRGVKWRQTGG
jgi:hypothetical protein